MLQNSIPSTYISSQIKPEDPIFGSATSIPLQNRNTTRDWSNFLPRYEKQSGTKCDGEDCVSFAKVQDIEGQVMFLRFSKLISDDTWQKLTNWGFINPQNGEFEASSRFIAIVSGTTPQGNSFSNVANAVQTYGLLPEADMPSEPGDLTWDQYYTKPTQAQLEKARMILSILKFDWQYVPVQNIGVALQMSPVQIATAVCPGWSTDSPIKTCALPVQHSTLVYDIGDYDRDYKILDHYEPFLKELAPNYQIFAAMQTVVSPIASVSPQNAFVAPKYGDVGDNVKALQQALTKDGEGSASLDVVGTYGVGTARAVYTFQWKYFCDFVIFRWLQKGRVCTPSVVTALKGLKLL